MNQSKVMKIPCEAEAKRGKITTTFGLIFNFDWTKKWREFIEASH